MFSRLREHFGTAGLLVAIVALVAALGGGAYAASGGQDGGKATASAKQGKQGKPGKTGKTGPAGPAGPAGAAGPAGPGGPKGDTGAAGSNGTNGTNGTSATTTAFAGAKAPCTAGGVEVKSASPTALVCNGQTGFTQTLPSGKTETGTWAAVYEEVGYLASISFSIPLAAPLDASHVAGLPLGYDGEDEIGTEHEACPGSAADPRAKPGYLCVYTGGALGSETEIQEIYDPSTGTPVGAELPGTASKGAATAGAGLLLKGGGLLNGTWAVTAPLAP